jgi:hypothetical protein
MGRGGQVYSGNVAPALLETTSDVLVPSLCNMKRISLTGIAFMDLNSQNFRTALSPLLISLHLVVSFIQVIIIHINFNPSIRKGYKQPRPRNHLSLHPF